MLITVEPGLYFIDYLIDSALSNPDQVKFINKQKLEAFRNFGGVRIEDDVLVTQDGIENLTVVDSDVDKIEAVMLQSRNNWLNAKKHKKNLFLKR